MRIDTIVFVLASSLATALAAPTVLERENRAEKTYLISIAGVINCMLQAFGRGDPVGFASCISNAQAEHFASMVAFDLI
ncbi:hypothetical protein N7456_012185 [Penicillium angulare]|uniref:Uncharacterized protein n=1 Tax=Penicillium angulare TaxID=116970 RepID=A0A9W9EV96_9EURO|nr:hypothetical protein N7456_012185 [Penicillium angulare]